MERLQVYTILTPLKKIRFVSKEELLARNLVREPIFIPTAVRNPKAWRSVTGLSELWRSVTGLSELWLLTDIIATQTIAGLRLR